MALRLSTGLRNRLMNGRSLRKCLCDGIIRIYSGSQPASADDAATGTLLVSITLGSGAFTEGVPSTAQKDTATLTYGSDGDTYALVINGRSYSYATVGGDDATSTAKALAAKVNEDDDVIATSAAGVITIQSMYPGETYTLANTGTTTGGNNVLANVTAASRVNGLHLGVAVAGVMAKEAGTWSGVGVATGTAGWFRYQANPVDNDTSSTTLARLDGNVATSGANLTMANTTVTSGATSTVDTFSLTEPAS
jgi:phage tail sheath gpL-like